jgi:hypothetical protein
MAKALLTETRIEGNEKVNVNLTAEMLSAMLEGVREVNLESYNKTLIPRPEDMNLEAPITKQDIENDIIRLEGFIDALTPYVGLKKLQVGKAIYRYYNEIAYLEKRLAAMLNFKVPEHRAIMIPQQTTLEGIFATCEHLGEGRQNEAWTNRRGEKFMTNGAGLNNLEKIIYYEAGTTAQGDAVLPHEDRSKRPWFKYAGGVKAKFGCTTEQAEELYTAFDILDTTATMAKTFESWIEKRGVEKAVTYFRSLAIPLMCVTDVGEPTIIDIAESYIEDPEIDADHPADIADVKADAYHKLDDPRDNMPTWETRQSKEFKFMLEIIRTASLSDLKTIGVALFKEKSHLEIFNKTQTTVIWDEYNRAKARKAPKLRPIALKALERLTDKKVNLSKVAAWLHGEGKKLLTAHEQSVIWATWKKCRKAYTPKQANLIPVEYYAPMETDYSHCKTDEEAVALFVKNHCSKIESKATLQNNIDWFLRDRQRRTH